MIDIAVPRDLDPNIADVEGVFLYDIDDLEGIVESNMEMRKVEAAKIERMIDLEMEDYYQWLRTLGVRPVIRALQEKGVSIHEETMDSLFNKLPELDEHQRKVIRRLTKSIVNQMTTDPINRIKEMAGTKQGDEALRMFTQIFALEDAVEMAAEKVNQSDATALGKPAVHLNENRQDPVPAYVPAGV
jgi:glutamyl-tRNA reductase